MKPALLVILALAGIAVIGWGITDLQRREQRQTTAAVERQTQLMQHDAERARWARETQQALEDAERERAHRAEMHRIEMEGIRQRAEYEQQILRLLRQ